MQDETPPIQPPATPAALVRCPGYEPRTVADALDRALALLGGLERFVRPGDRVLVKPNILNGSPAEACCTTHPAVVEAVLARLVDLGARPRIGDSPAFGWVRQVCEGNGIGEAARRHGVPLVEFVAPARVPNPGSGTPHHFYLDREVLDADAVINIPKLKSHRQLCYTGAVKNLYGCMPGKRKAYWHFAKGKKDMDFARLQASFAYAVKPTLNIADAVVAMERDGPQGGDPRPVCALVASPDCAATDAVLEGLIRPPSADCLILQACRELGLGSPDLASLDLRGDPLDDLALTDFVHPYLMGVAFSPGRIVRSTWRNFVLTRLRAS